MPLQYSYSHTSLSNVQAPDSGINRIYALVFQKCVEQSETDDQSLASNAKHMWAFYTLMSFTPFHHIISMEIICCVSFKGFFVGHAKSRSVLSSN